MTHADGSVHTRTYQGSEIQPDLAACCEGDSVALRLGGTDKIAYAAAGRCQTGVVVFDTTGRRLPAMRRGVNIMLCRDGTRRKVINR